MELFGIINYIVFILILASIYSITTMGLNIQWGLAGLFNVGISGFFGVGAYAVAIFSSPYNDVHIGGFDLPVFISVFLAMICAVIIAYPIGKICLKFRSDYLAICTIGISEIIRLILKSESWLSGGAMGVTKIPHPFSHLSYSSSQIAFLALMIAIIFLVYFLLEKQLKSPWGRMMCSIRDNEIAAGAMGKNIEKQRLIAFMLGSAFMGLSGAMYALFNRSITPNAIDPLITTFLVWIMLILGGSGNNKGAILGTFIILFIWSATELITDQLPIEIAIKAKYIRIFLIGLVLQLILRYKPFGILPEKIHTKVT